MGGIVQVWDLETTSDIVKFQGHQSQITAINSSLGNEFVVTGSKDCKVKLWDQRVSTNVATFRNNKGTIKKQRSNHLLSLLIVIILFYILKLLKFSN